MEINATEKNNKLNKELSTSDEVNLRTRIYTFFYYVLRKKDINILLCAFLLFLETLQLISFVFSENFGNLWNISQDSMHYVRLVVSSTRIAPLMTFIQFEWYVIIYACVIGYIFFHSLMLAMTLRFHKVNSKFYQSAITITRYFTSTLTIFLLIPFSELLLLMLKCNDQGVVSLVTNSISCWYGLHYLYAILSIIFSLVFYLILILLAIFYFDPFNSKKTATKIDTTADTFFYLFKIIMVIRYTALPSDWISIVIMVIGSLLNLKRAYENPTYNNFILECIISIRNVSVFWSYLVLLISKILEGTTFNGQFFLLIMGYPLIIFFSIIYYRRKSQNYVITNTNFNDANEFLLKLKYFKQLIDTFVSKSKSSKSNKANSFKKNEILLKGYISIHEESCVMEECPLKKFADNQGNFNIQKISLLHYMNIMFNEGIKKFPNSRAIIMNFVQFNYDKKYNLNAAKTFLTKLEKSQNSLLEDYIIFSIKQNISSSSNKYNRSMSGEEEMIRIEDSTEQKFKRMKFLIETATKLYGEFWGSLANNLGTNLNLKKLFFVGNKLNQILQEISQLWETDLKLKKIELENQGIVQLYSYFLREILKNKKKSDEINKKINEEQHYEIRRTESDKFDIDNIDMILENQDNVIYSRTNDKGECNIIQCSNSIVALLGYSKMELIGKKIEILMPGIYVSDHYKVLANSIKTMRTLYTSNKDNFRGGNEKKQFFILPKTKVGYLIPMISRFTIQNDDDFSNTFIVKSKFELRDSKSIYAYYILTKDDFTMDSISSSCLHIGLSMDLMKKYVINMNYLIRSEFDEEMNIGDKYLDYEEEPKRITWVFPDKLYPKHEFYDISKDPEQLESTIQSSNKKQFNLLINKVKLGFQDVVGYCFRLTEVEQRKGNQELTEIKMNGKRTLIYDMLKLNYVRTALVKFKSKEESIAPAVAQLKRGPTIKAASPRKDKKKKASDGGNSSDEELKQGNLLTKEKIAEYQGKSSEEIKTFINSLPFYGEGVSLFKRETETKTMYEDHITKIALIRQSMEEYITRRVQAKKMINTDKKREAKLIELAATNTSGSTMTSSDVNQSVEFLSDSSNSLNNIFNEKSVTNITYFSFLIFLLLCAIISIEFSISLSIVKDSKDRVHYVDKAYKILNSLIYTKFFLTETVLGQNGSYPHSHGNNTEYILNAMKEMSNYRQSITDTYAFFLNASISFDQSYYDYVKNKQVYIRTLSNGLPSFEVQPFETVVKRIPSTIFYVSTVNENYQQITMQDRNTYELMMNLLNDYLIVWRDVTFILVNDVKINTVSDIRLLIIFVVSFAVSLISIFVSWALINKFIDDREKPVDLFLTIRRAKCEELKAASENFLNKLLNKFFGNEEAEEENNFDTSVSLRADDINMTKINGKKDYKHSIRTGSEYLLNILKIVIFFLIFQIYMGFKYFYISGGMNNMNKFADVLNVTHYSQSDIVLSLNVAKQFFYDGNIPIFNSTMTGNIFKERITGISNEFQRLIEKTYLNKEYLSNRYSEEFYRNLNEDITNLIDIESESDHYLGTLKFGFKAVIVRYFELLRFLGLRYLAKPTSEYLNVEEFGEINDILRNVIRKWYNNLLSLLMNYYSSYVDELNLVNVSTFIVLIVSIIILYTLIWKSYEEKLRVLLKTSVDLINLIPDELKFQIVYKLNEEEEKQE